MYQTILLAAALQRWERYGAHALAARDLAAALARPARTPLHVLSLYHYDPLRVPPGRLPDAVAASIRDEEAQRTDELMQRKMAEYVAPLQAAGIAVAPHLRVGDPRELIVAVAVELHADLLILGSHSTRGLLDVALGGTAQQVTRRAPCPVVLVSPRR
jgi:nucleotide-binding universal stress UspA family protein